MSTQRLSTAAAALLVVVCGCLPATRRMSVPETVDPRVGTESGADAETTGSARERLAAALESPTLSDDLRRILESAEEWLGVPYRYGGNSRNGVDCSGLVCKLFGGIERRLPRTSREQSETGLPITLYDALPGDLVFFNTSGSGVSHVGILINGNEFVHASTSRGVIVSSLSQKYYRERFVSVRRVIPDAL